MNTDELLKKIKKEAPKLVLRNEKLGVQLERWIVEGDVGLSEERLHSYAAERVDLAERVRADPGARRRGLIAIERDGKILRWQRGLTLDYCVWRPSFKTDQEYEDVVRDMELATSDWAAICGVRFRHRQEEDTNEGLRLGDVRFPVLRHDGGGTTIAMAFFPDDPVTERIVWVFDGYWGGSFDPVGVLRHELGHALGFRHEHIRPEAPDFFNPESTEHTIYLTDYDPMSVMHYVAGGVGDSKLRFTDHDLEGAVHVYGGSDSLYSFSD